MESPYFLTLGPHAFYWFGLEPQPRPVAQTVLGPEPTRSLLKVRDGWHGVFKGRAKGALEGLLIQYLRGTRWFAGKSRVIRTAEFVDNVILARDSTDARIVLFRLTYTEGDPETYVICLAFANGERAGQIADNVPEAVIAPVQIQTRDGEERGLVFDALHDEGFAAAILDAVGRRRQLQGNDGKVIGTTTRTFRMIQDLATGPLEAAALKVEQSNSSLVYRDRSGLNLFVLKLFRRVEPGVNPDWEIGRYLSETKMFDNIARVTGMLEYRGNAGDSDEGMTLGVVQGYVQHEGEAWRFTLDSVGHYFERALARGDVHRDLPMPRQDLAGMLGENVPEPVADLIGPYLESVRLLGQRTAELHIALARKVDDADFAPEPFTDSFRKALYHSTTGILDQSFRLLRRRLRELPEDLQATGVRLLVLESEARNRLRPIRDRRISGMRTRIHGHYHLGQVLHTGKDFVILDFEGDPDRPLSERRIKRSPLRDVASMVRSLHYASRAALLGQLPGVVVRPEDRAALELAADFWFAWVSSTFLRAYLQAAAAGSFLPKSNEDLQVLLDVYLIDKAMSELMYDLRVRPDWAGIPMRGLLHLLSSPQE
jgi:maltose alpha-D-glucosyltransferase / alpha-amylase